MQLSKIGQNGTLAFAVKNFSSWKKMPIKTSSKTSIGLNKDVPLLSYMHHRQINAGVAMIMQMKLTTGGLDFK